MNKVFVFAYYSYKDPVFQSAVLPYLKKVQAPNLQYILLTWEQKQFLLTKNEIRIFEEELANYHITWKRTKWHSGYFKLIKKLFDFIFGLIYSLFLIFRHKASKIFSEGFPGAVIGHYLSRLSGKPHIIHTFEPHADYMKDAGVWTEKSWEYKLLKKLELPIANNCTHIITATLEYKKVLIDKGVKCQIWVIPSCIDFELFNYSAELRQKLRDKLGLDNKHIFIVYMGKMGGMYMEEEIFKFFSHLLKHDSFSFRFLLMTNASEELVSKYCFQHNIPKAFVNQLYVNKERVSEYLSAADIGFCAVRPIASQRYSSPIKNGEYWACGLPIIIPKGISDDYIIVEKENVGIAFNDFLELSVNDIEKLVTISRTKIRTIGLRERDINNYIDKWGLIFNG